MEVLAISADPPEASGKLRQTDGFTFPILPDPNTETIRRYGVLHPRGGEDGKDIARPAEFLIDKDRKIRWVNLTEDIRVRARAEQLMAAIDRLGT